MILGTETPITSQPPNGQRSTALGGELKAFFVKKALLFKALLAEETAK